MVFGKRKDDNRKRTMENRDLRKNQQRTAQKGDKMDKDLHIQDNVIEKPKESSEQGNLIKETKPNMSSASIQNNKSSSFLGLPMRLQEKQKAFPSVSKPSNIPISIKKDSNSSKIKLSSLINSSKSIADGKDKALRKDKSKNKSSSSEVFGEKINTGISINRKKSPKHDINSKKNSDQNKKVESRTTANFLPGITIPYHYKHGFGIKRNKVKGKDNDGENKCKSNNIKIHEKTNKTCKNDKP